MMPQSARTTDPDVNLTRRGNPDAGVTTATRDTQFAGWAEIRRNWFKCDSSGITLFVLVELITI